MSICTDETYFTKYQIPFPILVQRVLFLFDVDGVVCEALPYKIESELSREEYNKMIALRSCLPIFINTVEQIIMYPHIDIKFLTGRYNWSQNITENMFIQVGLGYLVNNILYYPNGLRWYADDYVNHKTKSIRGFLNDYDLVYFLDDTEPLMAHLAKVFGNDPRLKLIHINK